MGTDCFYEHLLSAWRIRDAGGLLRRWITLISVGWLPPDFTSSRSCLSLVTRVDGQPGPSLIVSTRVLLTGRPRPESVMPFCPWSGRFWLSGHGAAAMGPTGHVTGDGPQEARNRANGDVAIAD